MKADNKADVKCWKCGRKRVIISNKTEVQEWLRKMREAEEAGAERLIGGFIEVGENLVRVRHHSPVEIEVWGNGFPLEKRCWSRLCPYCMEKRIDEIRNQKSEKSKLKL